MIKRNRVKEVMKRGNSAYGVLVALPSPALVEMAGFAGFDFVIIDQEHGAISPETFENMIRAAESSGTCPFVRIRDSQPETILGALDRGAQGIVVPHVNTPEQALKISKACRFHPRGNRGLAAAGRAAGFGFMPPAEFFSTANEETILMPMIENREGAERIDEILSVEGIDLVMAGAGDLSQAYGVPGQPLHPTTQEVVTKIFLASKKAGVPFCAITRDSSSAKQWWEKGVRCFLAGDDQRIIYGAFQSLLKSVTG